MIIFVDTNIFMYAVGSEHPYKKPCADLLTKIAEESILVASDSEVLQEILYRYSQINKFPMGCQVYEDVKVLLNIVFPVTVKDIDLAVSLLKKHNGIRVRDAIHAAVMLSNDVSKIYSVDKHFDLIPRIKRIDPLEIPVRD